MPCCALAAGRGGQAGVGPEPAVAGRRADPAGQLDILWFGSAGYGLKELQQGRPRHTTSTTMAYLLLVLLSHASRSVRVRRQVPLAGGARLLVLWLLGCVTLCTGVGDGRGRG